MVTPVLVLVGGHEAAGGSDLDVFASRLPGAVVSPAGRRLHTVVSSALSRPDTQVVVVPMTFGREPTMVADTAKTLRWLATGDAAGRVALAQPFGTIDHLTSWLRRAANEIATASPGAGMVIAARRSNPFDDAELYRVAHLVRTHGAGNEVEVACVDTDADVAGAVTRLRLLGTDRAVIVPAGFARTFTADFTGELERASFYGPLMSTSAVLQVIADRTRAAQHDLAHGRDGIELGLEADHGHGYAHSHAFEAESGTAAGHTHPHGHQHHTHDGHDAVHRLPAQGHAAPHVRLTHEH